MTSFSRRHWRFRYGTAHHHHHHHPHADHAPVGGVVQARGAEVVLMPNGCLCCKSRGDLVEALRRLPLDGLQGVLLEMSGLSEVMMTPGAADHGGGDDER
jgi:hypothetical protein